MEPRLELEDGTVLYGEYEETLGSQLVFSGWWSVNVFFVAANVYVYV